MRKDLTINEAQQNQPWTVPYSGGVVLASMNGMPHVYGSHVVLHAIKTIGKISAVFERLDHTGESPNKNDIAILRNMSADLVTAALRLANLYEFNLSDALEERVLEKNGKGIR